MLRLNFLTLVLILAGFYPATAGELAPQQREWHKRYSKQANAPELQDMLLNIDEEPHLSDGFTPLFNGVDLSGWTGKGGTCEFSAVDGMIVGKCVPGSHSTYLSTEKADFTDFIFTCDMKWNVDCKRFL